MQVADLHAARSAAQDVADFQILQHFAGDSRGDADHRRHAEHGDDARSSRRPMAIISSAAITRVESVRPEIGLFEEPITPTRFPETAAKKNPTMIMTSAATTAAPITPVK